MVKAGMHLGHYSRQWNPRMKPFIYGQKKDLHLLDLVKSHKYFQRVLFFLINATARGQKVLFISTREQSASIVTQAARGCGSFYVTEKWLGGMLTNWSTLQRSTNTLRKLELQEKKGLLRRLPKKELASALRRKQKLQRNLGGVKRMTRLPHIAIIIGQNEELNALEECNKLGIRHITLLDTNNDPRLADLFIPANDDSVNSLALVLELLATAILDGKSIYRQNKKQNAQRTIRKSPHPLKIENFTIGEKKIDLSPKPMPLPVTTRKQPVLSPAPIRPQKRIP